MKTFSVIIFWLVIGFFLKKGVEVVILSLDEPNPDTIKTMWLIFGPIAVFAIVRGLSTLRKPGRWKIGGLAKLFLGAAALILAGAATFNIYRFQTSCYERIAPQARLCYCNFEGRDLSDRDLQGANLTAAKLHQANLQRANLTNAILAGADLSEADFTGAILAGAVLDRANFFGATGLNDDMLAEILHVAKNRVASTLSFKKMRFENRADIQRRLQEVCKGKGIAEAAIYNPKNNYFHPVVLLSGSGQPHNWSDDISDDWEPMAMRFCELVAAVDEEKRILLQTCTYTQGGIKYRYRYQMRIRLLNVRTGAAISSHTFYGTKPSACPQRTGVRYQELEGSHVGFSDVNEWLEKFVCPLNAELKKKDVKARRRAAAALTETGDQRAVEPLIAALQEDEDALVRSSAARGLGRLRPVGAIPSLLSAYRRDSDAEVRRQSMLALSNFTESHELTVLKKLAETDTDPETREAAKSALLKIESAKTEMAGKN